MAADVANWEESVIELHQLRADQAELKVRRQFETRVRDVV
jgi:hypothetical protein